MSVVSKPAQPKGRPSFEDGCYISVIISAYNEAAAIGDIGRRTC